MGNNKWKPKLDIRHEYVGLDKIERNLRDYLKKIKNQLFK